MIRRHLGVTVAASATRCEACPADIHALDVLFERTDGAGRARPLCRPCFEREVLDREVFWRALADWSRKQNQPWLDTMHVAAAVEEQLATVMCGPALARQILERLRSMPHEAFLRIARARPKETNR